MIDKIKKKIRFYIGGIIIVTTGFLLFSFVIQPILVNIDPAFAGQNSSSIDQRGRLPNTPAQFALYLTIISVPSLFILLYIIIKLPYGAFSVSKEEDISFFEALYIIVLSFIEIITPDWLW